MKKTLKQRLCSHEYTTVESMTTMAAAEKFVFETNMGTPARNLVYASPYRSDMVLYDKVCLKCKHCVTDLTDFRKKMANMTQEELDKLEIHVRKMYTESARRAAESRKRMMEARIILTEHLNNI